MPSSDSFASAIDLFSPVEKDRTCSDTFVAADGAVTSLRVGKIVHNNAR
jgi:hypothetical protein